MGRTTYGSCRPGVCGNGCRLGFSGLQREYSAARRLCYLLYSFTCVIQSILNSKTEPNLIQPKLLRDFLREPHKHTRPFAFGFRDEGRPNSTPGVFFLHNVGV